MAEPASSAGLLAKMAAVLSSGVLGAMIIAMYDPPKTRRELFLQATVAGVGAMIFSPLVLRFLGSHMAMFDMDAAAPLRFLEIAAPVSFVIGALSWGVFGALAKYRRIVKERAADAVAAKTIDRAIERWSTGEKK